MLESSGSGCLCLQGGDSDIWKIDAAGVACVEIIHVNIRLFKYEHHYVHLI